jgi:hypothetical protein
MGSHSVDPNTQKQASAGATEQDRIMAANAAKNQQYADQTRQSLFGNYDSTTGRYAGGTVSQYLDPNSINQKGLSGSYLDTYNNNTNKLANHTKNALSTVTQDMANRGMGKTPAGFTADMERKAYQDQAGQQGDLYAAGRDTQRNDAETNYWNATNMLNANASQTSNLSLQGNQAAAQNYANLYGTSSQQVQSGWGSVLGAAAGVGSAAIGAWCPVVGSLVLMADGSEKLIEEIRSGDSVKGLNGDNLVLSDPEFKLSWSVEVNGAAKVSVTHEFIAEHGGYVLPVVGANVKGVDGTRELTTIVDIGQRTVVPLNIAGDHTFCADGFWAQA